MIKKILYATTVSQSIYFYFDIAKEMKNQGCDIISISSPGKELEELESQNFKVYRIVIYRHISIIYDIISLIKIITVLIKEKPNFVHSMTPKAGLLCMLSAFICRIPKRLHTFTGLIWPTKTGLSRKIIMLTDWITCSCATNIIAEGQGVKNDLQTHITNKKIDVLGYGNVRGIDMIRFSLRQEIIERLATLSNKTNEINIFKFIFVGRIVKDKGINELIEAFVKINNIYPKTKLTLIGKYEKDLDPIDNYSYEQINHNPSIEYAGPKYDDDLVTYYAASDCFVFPSYKEGFPYTVLEAGAMGLPCIVTDINGSREIIQNGKNGLIIPPQDTNALYNAMESIIVNMVKTKEMANNARIMIDSRYNKIFVQKCLLEYYKKIINN